MRRFEIKRIRYKVVDEYVTIFTIVKLVDAIYEKILTQPGGRFDSRSVPLFD